MSRSGPPEKLHEGWLTKSPPTKRRIGIFKGRWMKRWFLLHCGELPGQYQLTYYTDRNCRNLKGAIDLDRCEQVDVGFKYEDKKLKFDHMFNIKTPARTYYLAAESEAEMKNWAKLICDVCSLKLSEEDEMPEYISSVGRMQQPQADLGGATAVNVNGKEWPKSTPMTPTAPIVTSTSPYIHISECVTGRSPVQCCHESVVRYNVRNGGAPSYLNLSGIQDMFYDEPRSHHLHPANYCNLPPPHSPAGSDAVFEDESVQSVQQQPAQPQPVQPQSRQLSLDLTADTAAATMGPPPPPRPPKPTNAAAPISSPRPTYFNLGLVGAEKVIGQDDMYDFPRTHQTDGNAGGEGDVGGVGRRRHCYNNAAPANATTPRQLEGEIFTYDSQSRLELDATTTSAASPPSSPPHSAHSTTNPPATPSPLPPVHRDRKPTQQQRKLSDAHSVASSSGGGCGDQPPASPSLVASAPIVDRKKKPTLLLLPDVTQVQQQRAAPSPQPPSSARSHETLLHGDCKVSHYEDDSAEQRTFLEYLDLDKMHLGGAAALPSDSSYNTAVPSSPGAKTVYKQVDFMKTEAFNLTRKELENERRQEHVPLASLKK